MKKLSILSIFIFSLAFTSFLDCNKSDEKITDSAQVVNSEMNETNETEPTVIRILPLGDSRVEGATTNSVSYRYDLWKQLVEDRWNFDYIGTQNDNTSYPVLLGKYFDPDHQGIGGYKTQDILDNLVDIIEDVGIPDVVLLGIGGNDLVANVPVSTAIENINQTIYKTIT